MYESVAITSKSEVQINKIEKENIHVTCESGRKPGK